MIIKSFAAGFMSIELFGLVVIDKILRVLEVDSLYYCFPTFRCELWATISRGV